MHCDHIVETSYRLTTVPLLSQKSPKRDAIRTLALLVGPLGWLAGELTLRILDWKRSSSFREETLWRPGPPTIGPFAFDLNASWWSGEASL